MKFLGIDFGWHGKPSGLAVLKWERRRLRLEESARLTTLDQVLSWVDKAAGRGPAMVAVDAPTIIGNASGMRAADRLMHRHFGRFHAGCYPANLGQSYASRTLALGIELERMGFRHAYQLVPRQPARLQIEVHPHAAAVCLFDLPRIIKYKRGRLAERRLELARYRDLMLECLPLADPPLAPFTRDELGRSGAALKESEDRLDATLCAYVGAHWWSWGAARNLVCGSLQEGYIVVPAFDRSTGRGFTAV